MSQVLGGRLSYMVTTPEVASVGGLCWAAPPEVSLPQIAELGYAGIELQTRDPESFDPNAFARIASDNGLIITGVSTAPAVVEDGLYLVSPDAAVRQASVRRMESVIELAARYGTHATIGRMRGFARWAPSRDTAFGWLRDAVERLVDAASDAGVRIVIEPQNKAATDMFLNVAEAVAFCESFGTDVLAIEADTYHMLLQERSVIAALVSAHRSRRLAHVQIGDTNRQPPGRGCLNWADFFATLNALEYEGWVAVECEQLPDSAAAAAQAMRLVRAMEVAADG